MPKIRTLPRTAGDGNRDEADDVDDAYDDVAIKPPCMGATNC